MGCAKRLALLKSTYKTLEPLLCSLFYVLQLWPTAEVPGTVQGFVDELLERSSSTKFKGALCHRHRTGSGEHNSDSCFVSWEFTTDILLSYLLT